MNKEFILEWSATAILLVGVAMAAFNVFPYYLMVQLIGNAMWFILGMMWRKWSLVTVQGVIVILYIIGMVNYYNG
ncbi:MAG: hypothetical protein EBU90_26740 [Proteobacteria bacterium]|nr:hypothetical protein [Pseudomonadota bacterium]